MDSSTTGFVLDETKYLEAEDGVVDVALVAGHLTFPWMALPAGPRRWAPTDLSVEVADGVLQLVRLTYRTVGDRSVVVAGARPDVDAGWLAEQIATPLLFAHMRRLQGTVPPAVIMSALTADAVWDEDLQMGGWQFGRAGVGERPVRLARLSSPEGHVVVAAHGVAAEELDTLVAGLVPVTPDAPSVTELQDRHRRALAQRWWDAPRAPWTPED